MNCNAIQTGLVRDSRRIRSIGFKHKAITGDIRARLLINALDNAIPELSFDTGEIILKGSKKHSKQCDIISHVGTEPTRICEYAAVPEVATNCIIEVKTWPAPNHFTGKSPNFNTWIDDFKAQVNLPIFLVGFRHSESKDEIMQLSESADDTFLFASGKQGQKTEDIVHPGEFERLIEAIRSVLSV